MSIKSILNDLCNAYITGAEISLGYQNPFMSYGYFGYNYGYDDINIFQQNSYSGNSNFNIFQEYSYPDFRTNSGYQNFFIDNTYTIENPFTYSDRGANTKKSSINTNYYNPLDYEPPHIYNIGDTFIINDLSSQNVRYDNISIKPREFVLKTNSVVKTRSADNTTVKEPVGKHDLAWWKAQGYDEEMGKKLGKDACDNSRREPHQCSGYTRRTLNRIYGTNFDNGGQAYKFGTNILSNPSIKGKFKKINVKGLKNGEFPEGAIVIWYPGTPGYTKSAAAISGHVATVHNGKGYSNGSVSNLSTYSEVWIPVKQS